MSRELLAKLERKADWKAYALKLHRRALTQWRLRWRRPERVALTLHEIRAQELYKELGYSGWVEYLKAKWPKDRMAVGQWEYCSRLLVRYPEALTICASQGVQSINKVAQFAGLCETRDDVLWWSRLARVMSQNELRRTVNAAREARRTGTPGISSVFLGAFVDGLTYTRLVKPAINEAKRALGGAAPPGQILAWLCARARGKVFRHPLGVDPGVVRNAGEGPPIACEPTGGALAQGPGRETDS